MNSDQILNMIIVVCAFCTGSCWVLVIHNLLQPWVNETVAQTVAALCLLLMLCHPTRHKIQQKVSTIVLCVTCAQSVMLLSDLFGLFNVLILNVLVNCKFRLYAFRIGWYAFRFPALVANCAKSFIFHLVWHSELQLASTVEEYGKLPLFFDFALSIEDWSEMIDFLFKSVFQLQPTDQVETEAKVAERDHPISKSVSFSRITKAEAKTQPQCPICLEVLRARQMAARPGCHPTHFFHLHCAVRSWDEQPKQNQSDLFGNAVFKCFLCNQTLQLNVGIRVCTCHER